MKRFFVFLAIVMIAMLSLSRCAKKADVAADTEAVRKADADWNAAMGSKNVDEFMKYFAEDGVLMMPNMPAMPGVPTGAIPGAPKGYTPPGTKSFYGGAAPRQNDRDRAKAKRKAEKKARKKNRR